MGAARHLQDPQSEIRQTACAIWRARYPFLNQPDPLQLLEQFMALGNAIWWAAACLKWLARRRETKPQRVAPPVGEIRNAPMRATA